MSSRRTAPGDEAPLELFYEAAPIMMGVIEIVGDDVRHLAHNPMTTRFFGVDEKSFRERSASEQGAPRAVIETWIRHCRAAREKGGVEVFEYEHAVPAGRRRLCCRVSSLDDREGRELYACMAEDVTERRSAEQGLRQSEGRFRATFEQAAVGMAHVAPDGRWLRVNRRLCDIVGYPREELLAGRFQGIAHPDDADDIVAEVAQLLAGAIDTCATEKRYVRKDGSIVWVNLTVSLVRKPTGEPDYLIGVVEDVDARVRAQQAVRQSEQLLAEAQKVAHIGSWQAELATDEVTWSSETYRIYGLSPQTFRPTRESFLAQLHPDDRATMEAWIGELVEGRRPGSHQFKIIRPDGEVRFLEGHGHLLRDRDGRPTRAIGAVIDITERKRAESERAKLEEQLRLSQKMEAIGQLAGGVAHDFNNLLFVILSHVSFATAALRNEDPLRDDLEPIHQAATRAATLTRQLLAFGRKQVLEPKPLDLNHVVADLEPLLRRLIGEGIDLVTALASDLGLVQADPAQIEQVLMNLVVNARDAMPKGGKITIETANVDLAGEHETQHLTLEPGGYVLAAVTDTGCGMDAATLERLFEPFFTTKEQGKGTGLGLSTVYGIVKQSGGSISVYSEPDRGSTFKVYLPRLPTGTKPREVERPREDDLTGIETILVVEDEEAVRKLTARILRNAGFEVFTAANPGEALLASEGQPGELHLLLTDVVMPQMSGGQLAEHLRALRPTLRVLYMSGHMGTAIAHQGVLDPRAGFIGKPFTAANLVRKVREVLDDPPPS